MAVKNQKGPGGRRGRNGAETEKGEKARDRILAAAIRVFSRLPFKAASTRMIAREAGVDHPLIHYYFGSKEKLYEAVAEGIYKESREAQQKWLEGLERMRPKDGLAVYLDRLLDYNQENPEPFQLIILNMAQVGSVDEVPGFQYITMHLESTREILAKKLPLRGSRDDIDKFIYTFTDLGISLLGARACQAKVLGMDPDGPEYRQWVKTSLLKLFAPWLERLIFPDEKQAAQ